MKISYAMVVNACDLTTQEGGEGDASKSQTSLALHYILWANYDYIT